MQQRYTWWCRCRGFLRQNVRGNIQERFSSTILSYIRSNAFLKFLARCLHHTRSVRLGRGDRGEERSDTSTPDKLAAVGQRSKAFYRGP